MPPLKCDTALKAHPSQCALAVKGTDIKKAYSWTCDCMKVKAGMRSRVAQAGRQTDITNRAQTMTMTNECSNDIRYKITARKMILS